MSQLVFFVFFQFEQNFLNFFDFLKKSFKNLLIFKLKDSAQFLRKKEECMFRGEWMLMYDSELINILPVGETKLTEAVTAQERYGII